MELEQICARIDLSLAMVLTIARDPHLTPGGKHLTEDMDTSHYQLLFTADGGSDFRNNKKRPPNSNSTTQEHVEISIV